MSQHTARGRHRAPSRLSTTVASTARVSAAVAVSGGLVATVAAPANAAQGVGRLATSAVQVAKPAAPVAPLAAPTVGGSASAVITHGRPAMPRMVLARELVRTAPQAARPTTATTRTSAATTTRRAATARTETARRATTQRASRTTTRPSAPASPAPAPSSASTSRVVEIAKRYIGTPYIYGGTTPRGFDCSGFTSYMFRQIGIELPRTARAQQAFATRVSTPRPGDLVFYNFPATHVMIYVGNGLVIDSPSPGKTVQVHKMWGSNISYGRVS